MAGIVVDVTTEATGSIALLGFGVDSRIRQYVEYTGNCNKILTHEFDVFSERSSNAGSETIHIPVSPILPGSLAIRNVMYAVQC